jgi:hypothetical protein
MLLVGCTKSNISVHVLDQKELVRIKKSQSVNATFDGWLFSDVAVQRIMDAKIKEANLK